MLNFKIFNNINNECEKIWREFEINSINDYFQTFDYHKELINNYNLQRLNIIVIFFDKEPIALFPFYVKKYFLIKILMFLGTKYSDYCNPIINPKFINYVDNQNFIEIWKEIINKVDDFDLFFFNNQLSAINNFQNPIVKYLNAKKFSSIYLINLPSKFDFYKKSILEQNKKFHYEIHRTLLKKEKLKKNHQLNFEIKILNKSDFKLEELVESKIKKLKKKKRESNLENKIVNLYNNLNKKDENKFLMATLKVDDEIISACFCIQFNNKLYYYMPIILSEKYEKYKIGKILLLEIINWCIEMNIVIFDFGLGAEKYKKYFSNVCLNLFRFYNFNSLKGFIALLFMKLILKF